jgi:hypothetical protein
MGGDPQVLIFAFFVLFCGYSSANEVAPDPHAAPYLDVRFADALSFPDRRCTGPLCTDPVSRPDRHALHFGRSRVLGCGFFHL